MSFQLLAYRMPRLHCHILPRYYPGSSVSGALTLTSFGRGNSSLAMLNRSCPCGALARHGKASHFHGNPGYGHPAPRGPIEPRKGRLRLSAGEYEARDRPIREALEQVGHG
jgi:diadenosine tetraphosphate (Ap4A) HIT family hydrolase